MDFTFENARSFGNLYGRIEKAFPYEERRDIEDEEKLFDKGNFRFTSLIDEGKTVGVATFYEEEEFVFLEHLAIDENLRGKGYGSVFLIELKNRYDKPIILEVEPPTYDYAKKRIGFYQKNGFFLNEKTDYFQPSYHDQEDVPLLIMSSKPLTKEETEIITKKIWQNCYDKGK